ncbi:MAG: hypothetical protein ACYTEW_21495 [Planctomycetota bacterium]|jgi:hypothetical protein
MNGRRFDVIYWEHGPKVDYHFCREWDEDGGCYGTNPLHGLTWEEARDLVAMWYKAQAEYWEDLKEKEWGVNMTNEELEWAKDGTEEVSLSRLPLPKRIEVLRGRYEMVIRALLRHICKQEGISVPVVKLTSKNSKKVSGRCPDGS